MHNAAARETVVDTAAGEPADRSEDRLRGSDGHDRGEQEPVKDILHDASRNVVERLRLIYDAPGKAMPLAKARKRGGAAIGFSNAALTCDDNPVMVGVRTFGGLVRVTLERVSATPDTARGRRFRFARCRPDTSRGDRGRRRERWDQKPSSNRLHNQTQTERPRNRSR